MLKARLNYRKFDTTYVEHFQGKEFTSNELPVMLLAEDKLTLPVSADQVVNNEADPRPLWMRWNDYGNGVVIDKLGNSYIVGYTASTDLPMINAYDSTGDYGLGRIAVS